MLSGKKVEAEDEIKSDEAELDITIAGVTNQASPFITEVWNNIVTEKPCLRESQ